MQPDELTLPLWRVLWRAAVRAMTLAGETERWSHLSTAERAERRAHWPAWRRAVRPLGLAVVWSGVICSVALGEHSSYLIIVKLGGALLLLPIGCISLRDWLRDIPSKRAAPSRSSLQGIAAEDPAP